MPTYNFRNKESGEIIERIFKMSEKDDFLKENPQFEFVMLSPPALGDPIRLGVRKPDNGFREVLAKAKAAHPKGNVNTF